jgi:hypothetical protein
MARRILLQEVERTMKRVVHEANHDVESFIWVLSYWSISTSHNFKPGDPVFALTSFLRDWAFAEYTIALPSEVAHKPRGIDFIEAASIPLSTW